MTQCSRNGLPVNTEWPVIFIPGPKCGSNLVAFHISSFWTNIWLPEIKESESQIDSRS